MPRKTAVMLRTIAIEDIAGTRPIVRGTVAIAEHNDLRVEVEGEGVVRCDVLLGALPSPGQLEPGTTVLVALPERPGTPGCVLGVVEPYRSGSAGSEDATCRRIAGEKVVVEAGSRLELRVKDSTIVITEDGKIMIRGRDVLSRAKGMNRIKGGTVSIN